MKVLLVYPAPPRGEFPRGAWRTMHVPTGIACMATVLRRGGHQVKVFLMEEVLNGLRFDWDAARTALRNLLTEFRPEIVGLSLVTPGVPQGIAAAEDAKDICGPQTLVVAGGPHATAMPEGLLNECPLIDVAVIGEGEMTLLELADNGPSASVKGIVFRKDGQLVQTPPRSPVHDLDTLGPPAYDLFNMKYHTQPSRWLIRWLMLSATNIRTSRGCSNRCTFCAGHLVSGLGLRYHSIEYVIDQMRWAQAHYGVGAIHFEDDTLGGNPARLMELCQAIRAADLHKTLQWDACLRVDQAQPELLAEMKRSGCIQVEFGFESGSTAVLKRLGKATSADMNRRALELAKQAHLRVFADIMVGLPGETAEDFEATIRFLRWGRPEIISGARLCPLPGTGVYNSLPEEVRSRLTWGGYSYMDSPGFNVNLTAMSDEEFERRYRRFQKYIVRPQTARALLRDTPADDIQTRRGLRAHLRRFILRHPIRAISTPWS